VEKNQTLHISGSQKAMLSPDKWIQKMLPITSSAPNCFDIHNR